jgi:Rps23 Pro-64 3,4-dihydroxylase Tpa1-like proline 4-hydroxylase
MKLYFNISELEKLAKSKAAEYKNAKPFPHIVIDNFMNPEPLKKVLEDFPSPDKKIWREYENYFEGKLEAQGEEKVSDFTSQLLYQFNSAPFLYFLETLTGIKNLMPDPYFLGGGLHQLKRGGKLGIHADFNEHGKLPHLSRRVNAIIYLNENWLDEYNGHLELWDTDMTTCVQKIAPIFNRLAVFDVTDYNYHGVPDLLNCPENMTRKSIGLFYFTVGRPEQEIINGKKSTLFLARPGEEVPKGTQFNRDNYDGVKVTKNFNWLMGQILPPFITNLLKTKNA